MLTSPWIIPRSDPKDVNSKFPRTTSENICIPAQLQAVVPGCALGCIRAFVLNNYSNHACSSTASLSFLCRNPTFSGLTIGEGSLQCVVSNCFNFNAQTQSGYTICDGMADAIPNLAGTITATISAINSLTASQPTASVTPELSLAVPSTTATASSALVSSRPLVGETISLPPYETSTSSAAGLSTGEVPPFVISTASGVIESSSAGRTTQTPQTSTNNLSSSRTSTPTTTIKASSSSTGTSAAVNEPTERNLSTSAIAGIVTASVVVIALILGYLAYFLIVKRKARKNRRSQRLSRFFPPIDDNDAAGTGSATVEEKTAAISEPDRRFYAGETNEPRRLSLRQDSAIAPTNIGVAIAHDAGTARERSKVPNGRYSSQPYLTLFPVQRSQQRPTGHEDRWSIASSLDDDLEAQTQDVPILASPKSRSSARSASSTRMPKPPPLRLSKIKPSGQTRSSRIALTPVYDNGNFETTIRRVPSDPSNETDSSANDHHFQVPARSMSRDGNRPFWSQNRRTLQRFPIKVASDSRRRTESSTRSVSLYTDIEEDSTPEMEEDKQLSTANTDQTSLRDLAWPQIPRSASIAKQAVKPHSPRKIQIVRNLNLDATKENLPKQMQDKPVLIRDETSTTIQTESSASPIFPLPPNRQAVQAPAHTNGKLMKQISNAYEVAANPFIASTSIQTSNQNFHRSGSRSSIRRPGETYQGIQRLRTGRPLAHGFQEPDFPPPIPLRSPLRGKAPPFPLNSNGRYPRVIAQNF